MLPDVTIANFAKREHKIASVFRKIIRELKLEETVEIHEDRIAINIKRKISNKMFATKQFLAWLSYKNLHPEKFKAFGDAVSDLEIGHELRKNNLNFDFIYVGNPKDIKHQINFPIISTLEKFGKETDEGTLDYLKQE
jgi:histidinol phosphatase-like enzyme